MGWFDGFPFKTKEQIERERKEFEGRVFHLGEGQRELVIQRLNQLLTRNKLQENEKLYAYISAKDKYAYHKGDEGIAYAKSALRQQKWLNDQEVLLVLALVILDTNLESLEEYPTIQEIEVMGKTLTVE